MKSLPRAFPRLHNAGFGRVVRAASVVHPNKFLAYLVTGAWIALVLLPTLALSQDPTQTPRIHVTTRLVQVGVIVRDKNGPVEDLTQRDFVLFDQGKPRAINLFSVRSAEPAEAGNPVQTSSPNMFSNLPRDKAARLRSVTVVLLDNLNTLYGSSAESQYEHTPYWMEDLALRDAQLHLIEFIKQLQPQDRVAIYGLRHTLQVLCDFTSDREQLLAILKKYDTRSVTNRTVVEPGNTISS